MIKKLFFSTLCVLTGSAFATDYAVTTTDDNGPGSLRAAIESLEEAGDTITFDTNLIGTITLQSNLPILTLDTVITGPTNGSVTIDGNSEYRIFEVNSYTSVSNLNLINPDPLIQGGAFLIGGFGLLMAENVAVQHCSSSCEAPIKIAENGGLFSNNLMFSSQTSGGVDVFFEEGSSAVFGCDAWVESQVWVDGSGPAVVYKEGDGVLNVKSQSSLNMLMIADYGLLRFSDTTTQPIYAVSPGILEGTPTAYYFGNMGTMQTGSDFGTITNDQEYYQDANANLVTKIDANGGCDLLHADLVGHLAGNLIIQLAPGDYTTSTAYTLVKCDEGFSNPFDAIYFDMGQGLESVSNASLSYTSDSVILTITSDFTVAAPLPLAKNVSNNLPPTKMKRAESPVTKLYKVMMARKKRQGKSDVIHTLNEYPKQLKKELFTNITLNDRD